MELQVAERSLDGCAATVEVAPALRMPWNAREQPPAERERQGALIGLRATERNDGFAAALLALGVDAAHVVTLVGGARLGAVAASVERVEQRRDVEGVVAARCLNAPRERKAGARASGQVELVPVERACASRTDRASMAPGRFGIGEPFPLRPVVGDSSVAVGEGFEVARIDRHVPAEVREPSCRDVAMRSRQSARSGRFSRSLRANLYMAQTLGVSPSAACKPGCSAINAVTHVHVGSANRS